MKTESLKSLSDNDILSRRADVMRDLMVAQFQLRTGQLEDSSRLGKLRKSLARLNTELRRREIAAKLPTGALLSRNATRPSEVNEATAEAAPAKRSRFGLGFIRDTLLGRRS